LVIIPLYDFDLWIRIDYSGTYGKCFVTQAYPSLLAAPSEVYRINIYMMIRNQNGPRLVYKNTGSYKTTIDQLNNG
ncbi:TPA: hypothetical protein ACVOVL_004931, partial [Citrobacter braakii]